MLSTALSLFMLVSAVVSIPISHPLKRDVASDAKSRCEDHTFADGDHYALIIYFKQSASIGGGGAGLDDSGAFFTFNSDCEQIEEIEWNGGSGSPDPILYEKSDSDFLENGEMRLKFEMEGALLKDDFISVPDNVEAGNDDDGFYDGPALNCDDVSTDSGFGFADAWRTCTFVG